MIKSALETAYKVFYNHYVKLDKSNKGADTMAKINLSTSILLVILNILTSFSIIANIKLIPSSKPTIWLLVGIYLLLSYQFISRTLKLDKPLNDIFVEVNVSRTRLVWSIYGTLLILIFAQGLLKKFL